MFTIQNCTFDSHGKLERISIHLLNMFANAFVVITGIADPILDRRLVRAKSCLHSKTHKRTKNRMCASPYHQADQPREDLDLRSRAPICKICYNYERTIAEASWPTLDVLRARVHAQLVAQIAPLFEHRSCRQWLMSLVTPFPHHDLQLHKYRKKEGAVFRAICPSAATLFRMARSSRADEFDASVSKLVSKGWTRMKGLPANFGIGFHVYDDNIIVLSDLVSLIRVVAKQPSVILKLVSKHTTRPEWSGPCHLMGWGELVAAVKTGLPLYGARAGVAWSPFEVLISISDHQSNIELSTIGPEHNSATVDPTERSQLLEEERNPWHHEPFPTFVWSRIRPDQPIPGTGVRIGKRGLCRDGRFKRRRLQGVSEESCQSEVSQSAAAGPSESKEPGQCASVGHIAVCIL